MPVTLVILNTAECTTDNANNCVKDVGGPAPTVSSSTSPAAPSGKK